MRKGQKNIYLCSDCGHGWVSQDVDEGVTPFIIPCLNCEGSAKSFFYNIPDIVQKESKPVIEWYKPIDTTELSDYVKKHVEQGGLVKRIVK